MRRLSGLIALLIGLCVYASAWAQSGPLIIDGARPDRGAAAPPAAASAPTPARGQVKNEAKAFRPFKFTRVDVHGSSLPAAQLRAAVQPYVGRTLALKDVAAVADAIGGTYATSNIALYSILVPDQTFADGVVRLRVLEGFVSTAGVKPGLHDARPTLTRAYAQTLTGKRPLLRADLERQLGLMRDIPGARPDIQLVQGDQPGAVGLAVTPMIQRFEASVSVNNRGPSLLGRTQIEIDGHLNGLFREGERSDLTVAFPTEFDRFQFVGLGQREPVGANGDAVQLNLGYLRTRPKLPGLDVVGHANSAGIAFIRPVIRSNLRNLNLTLDLDGVNSDNALFGQQISQERTRALRASAAFSDQTTHTATSASVSVSQGIDGLGARMAAPSQSEAGFHKADLQLARVVFNDRMALRLQGSAQVTGDSLPGSEKFAVGGAQFGRAFGSGAISGDTGLAVSAEFAVLRGKTATSLKGSEAYVFADYGHVGQNAHATPLGSESLASIGAGIRVKATAKTIVELELAKALQSPASDPAKPLRLMINLRSTF